MSPEGLMTINDRRRRSVALISHKVQMSPEGLNSAKIIRRNHVTSSVKKARMAEATSALGVRL